MNVAVVTAAGEPVVESRLRGVRFLVLGVGLIAFGVGSLMTTAGTTA